MILITFKLNVSSVYLTLNSILAGIMLILYHPYCIILLLSSKLSSVQCEAIRVLMSSVICYHIFYYTLFHLLLWQALLVFIQSSGQLLRVKLTVNTKSTQVFFRINDKIVMMWLEILIIDRVCVFYFFVYSLQLNKAFYIHEYVSSSSVHIVWSYKFYWIFK